MTVAAPVTKPFPVILDNASLQIGTADDPLTLVELACVATHVELAPDVATTTIDTFCGSTDYPGNVKWSLNATLVQSLDTDATEDTLSAAVESGGPVPFAVKAYRDLPTGPNNPEWSGMVVPQPYAPLSGDAGAESTIDLAWALTDAPVKSIAPGGGAAAAATEAKSGKAA
jgi:hypothetical protein